MIRITDTITLDNREIEERFVRAFGPGGQNVRKEATAVELRFDVGASSLPTDVKKRLIALAGGTVTTDGVLVVMSRAYRVQTENRKAARVRFVALLQRAARPPKIRQPTTPGTTVQAKRMASKKFRSAVKQSRHGGRPGED